MNIKTIYHQLRQELVKDRNTLFIISNFVHEDIVTLRKK